MLNMRWWRRGLVCFVAATILMQGCAEDWHGTCWPVLFMQEGQYPDYVNPRHEGSQILEVGTGSNDTFQILYIVTEFNWQSDGETVLVGLSYAVSASDITAAVSTPNDNSYLVSGFQWSQNYGEGFGYVSTITELTEAVESKGRTIGFYDFYSIFVEYVPVPHDQKRIKLPFRFDPYQPIGTATYEIRNVRDCDEDPKPEGCQVEEFTMERVLDLVDVSARPQYVRKMVCTMYKRSEPLI